MISDRQEAEVTFSNRQEVEVMISNQRGIGGSCLPPNVKMTATRTARLDLVERESNGREEKE
ncbi:hypothetical protein TIFTF001_046369 [Ficus carica]|uniref:Uncharacterized protein n=1 Tax=Ficus carica TaxID=3494 RepID=A0AA88CSD0_FICCA|nr:hypothetical protein TIFTF001_046369 [Ficus carica]